MRCTICTDTGGRKEENDHDIFKPETQRPDFSMPYISVHIQRQVRLHCHATVTMVTVLLVSLQRRLYWPRLVVVVAMVTLIYDIQEGAGCWYTRRLKQWLHRVQIVIRL